MGSNPSDFKGSDRLPVETVSWNEVQEWMEKMKEQGLKPRIAGSSHLYDAEKLVSIVIDHKGALTSTDRRHQPPNDFSTRSATSL